MHMTRITYLALFFVNLAINGLALAHVTGRWLTDDHIVPAALVLNMVLWPVVIFAAYRAGGMTEEIYRSKEDAVHGAAVAAQKPAGKDRTGKPATHKAPGSPSSAGRTPARPAGGNDSSQ